MNYVIGVCLGASTVSFVKAGFENDKITVIDSQSITHNGNPKEVFQKNLIEFNKDKLPVAVTGRKFRSIVSLPSVSEPEATELAFNSFIDNKQDFTAIASVGGETFMVYSLDKLGKISGVFTKNQCASGTGEFFLQQIKRMNLSLDDVAKIDDSVTSFRVSGRCSVFCKSDCTHALNKGIPKADVICGLSEMMAEKVEELLKKKHQQKVLIVGGVTKNTRVMNFLKKSFPDIVIPEYASCFEALGAAVFAHKNNVPSLKDFENIFVARQSSFPFLHPLSEFKDKVTFKEMKKEVAQENDKCIVGLDVGSTTTKAVLLRTKDNAVLASIYLYTHGDPIAASKKCYSGLLEQIPQSIKKLNIVGVGVTGSGRHIAGLHALTDGVFNEIIAHATAAVYFDNSVDTIFEIGGQDAKYTYIVNKVPADYAMNEACSAGTGSFIEESAFESLGIPVTEIESIAMRGKNPPNFSDQCAAFISSDIKTALQENIDREDIVAGLVYSICFNYVNRVKGNRPVGSKIFMQGGVCYNKAIPIAMAALTGQDIVVPPEPGLMGAFGVALEVKDKIALGLLSEKPFDLRELSERTVNYKKPFICAGGKEHCDIKCSINMIEVNGKTYPFGGACNKYYNLLSNHKPVDNENYDYVKRRHYLTFEKYAPKLDLPDNATTVGLNGSFHTHTLFPLYYNFFTQLGFKVIVSDTAKEEGMERELSSFCYPAQLSLGLFQDLLDKNPDYIFLPGIMEMYVNDETEHKKDSSCTCAFLNTEVYFLKQAFKDYDLSTKFVTGILRFSGGWDSQEEQFVAFANQMGINDNEKIKAAYHYAAKVQTDYQQELFSIGEQFLKYLESHPDEFAIVLVGRPYNSFNELANKGIPQKFASRGIHVIPYDMFDYRDEIIDDNQYWESGKKILKVAKLIKRHPQLFATYISNFSCAPDSMIMTTFRTIMGTKPSLTLELDGHTADSGINTRIDAALDIITNYRRISSGISDPYDPNFHQAYIKFEDTEVFFMSSEGEKIPMNDPRVKILIPSMGDLSSRMFAAAVRSMGFNAIAMPEGTPQILKYGRQNTSGKECLPLILCAGSMINYLENHWNGTDYIAYFIVQGAGDCRLGQYPVILRNIINRKRLRNVTPMALSNEEGFAGLGSNFAVRGIQAIITADVLDDVRSGILSNAKDPDKGLEVFNREFDSLIKTMESDPKSIYAGLKQFSKTIKDEIPAAIDIDDSRYIALLGEMFVRRDGFSHKWLNKYFAKKHFIVKDANISEWFYYLDYLSTEGVLDPLDTFSKRKERFVRNTYMTFAENKIKKILEKTGYYKYTKINVEPLIAHSKHVFPIECRGETGLTVGTALYESLNKYSGIINVGPFGCMPTRTSEAVGTPEMTVGGKLNAMHLANPQSKLSPVFDKDMTIPFLTIEADGNVYPQVIEAKLETFALQCERISDLIFKARKNGTAH